MTTIHAPEPRSAIEAAGNLPDAELDIAAVALQLARVDAPDADWRQVAAHFSDIARSVVEAATLDSKADKGDLEARRLILAEALHGRFGYQGDSETYDDMANANLIRVVERRRGLPVALGILWLHAADAAGWAAYGVDFPGHFLLALEGPRGKLILDVFAGGKVLEAQDLRALIKRDFELAFDAGIDAILTPATPSSAFGLGEMASADPVEMYLNDVFTVTVNLAGLPGVSVPVGLDAKGLPLGLQLIGRPWDEAGLLNHAYVLEQAAGFVAKPAKWW